VGAAIRRPFKNPRCCLQEP